MVDGSHLVSAPSFLLLAPIIDHRSVVPRGAKIKSAFLVCLARIDTRKKHAKKVYEVKRSTCRSCQRHVRRGLSGEEITNKLRLLLGA
jgi:hypothetical protein